MRILLVVTRSAVRVELLVVVRVLVVPVAMPVTRRPCRGRSHRSRLLLLLARAAVRVRRAGVVVGMRVHVWRGLTKARRLGRAAFRRFVS